MRLLNTVKWMPAVVMIAGLLVASSCKKDDEKPKSGISFESESEDVNESDGTIEVKINLTRPVSEKVVLAYSLAGTATIGQGDDDDYSIKPTGGYITLEPGDSDFTLEVMLKEDGDIEIDVDNNVLYETIVIKIDEVVSGPAMLEESIQHTINVYEDDMIVYLTWKNGAVEATDVDMDIFAWIDDPNTAEEDLRILNSETVGGIRIGTDYELVIIYGGLPEGKYGFSYVYYEGTSDDLNFTAEVTNFGGSINGGASTKSFEGHYTKANINKWDDEAIGTNPVIRQTATKSDLNFVDFTAIDLLKAGTSRIKKVTGTFDRSMKRGSGLSKKDLRNIVDLY